MTDWLASGGDGFGAVLDALGGVVVNRSDPLTDLDVLRAHVAAWPRRRGAAAALARDARVRVAADRDGAAAARAASSAASPCAATATATLAVAAPSAALGGVSAASRRRSPSS